MCSTNMLFSSTFSLNSGKRYSTRRTNVRLGYTVSILDRSGNTVGGLVEQQRVSMVEIGIVNLLHQVS